MRRFKVSCEKCNHWLHKSCVTITSSCHGTASVQEVFGRGVTIDGSRAFQRPVAMRTMRFRRGATVERHDDIAPHSGDFNCRSATNNVGMTPTGA
jgi:hypothetical protein